MTNPIKTLKSITLSDAIASIMDKTMLDVFLDLTGIFGNLYLAIALLAKLEGDKKTADYSMAGGFVFLLAKVLAANIAEQMDDDVEVDADDDAEADVDDDADDDDSVDISLEDFGEA